MEKQFAVKAVEHLQTYWSLLEKVPGSKLKLSRFDQDIVDHVLKEFPEFEDPEFVKVVDEDWMKSPEGKKRWRAFINEYEKGEKAIDDFNFGTLLRRDASKEYSEENTMFVPRMQFYAVEILRNRLGLNDWISGQ